MGRPRGPRGAGCRGVGVGPWAPLQVEAVVLDPADEPHEVLRGRRPLSERPRLMNTMFTYIWIRHRNM